MMVKERAERICQNEIDKIINKGLSDLMSGKKTKCTFMNMNDANFRIHIFRVPDVGFRFKIKYFIPKFGSVVVKCNNIVTRYDYVIELVKEMISVSDLEEYTNHNDAEKILDMELESIEFLPAKFLEFGKVLKEIFKK